MTHEKGGAFLLIQMIEDDVHLVMQLALGTRWTWGLER